ncbi:MAG: hypothetical protein U0V18_16800 [Anaerolineales bacterium]
MKKLSFLYLFAGVMISLSACVPANGGLSGTGGQEEVPPTEPAMIVVSTEEAIAGSEGGQETTTVSFYAPSFTISTSKSGISKTGLSIEPIGIAEYQLSAPKILGIGEEGTIKLILVPPTVPLEKKEEFKQFEKDVLQAFQGAVDIYPNMKAEIQMGNAFSISPSSDISQEQLINTNDATTWLWFVTGQQAGKHSLAVDISVPALANGKEADFDLTHINFEIQVNPPPPTPTTIPSPVPTSTKRPSFGETLTGSASNITVALITSCATVLVAIFSIVFGGQQYTKFKSKKQSEDKKKALEKSAEDIKKNLPSKENTKKKN